jgi:hypothetical protein
MKKKSEISVLDAVRMEYEASGETFHAIIFVMNVRIRLGRPGCMDGTIMRRLRELRSSGEINYKVINSEYAIYEKI